MNRRVSALLVTVLLIGGAAVAWVGKPETDVNMTSDGELWSDIFRDGDQFAKLEDSIDRALKVDLDYLTDLVAHNVAIKARVVEADPFEKAERAHLNFGHTFGHAIETASEYSYSHGE